MTLAQLETYGVTFSEFVTEESLVGRFVIPSSLQANNKDFYQDNETTQKEAFRLIGSSAFDACDINCYFIPTRLEPTSYISWVKKVGEGNAFLFKKAIYCEIKSRMLANDFPELSNLTTTNINSLNVNNNSQQPIFTTDLLNKQTMSFLDQTTFNQIAKLLEIRDIKLDEVFAEIDFSNVSIIDFDKLADVNHYRKNEVYNIIQSDALLNLKLDKPTEVTDTPYSQGFDVNVEDVNRLVINTKLNNLLTHQKVDVPFHIDLENIKATMELEGHLKLKAQIPEIWTIKGKVDTKDDLPTEGNTEGDTYYVVDVTAWYIWTEEAGWLDVAATVDMSNYYTKAQTDNITGDLTQLKTTDKSNVVNAINETHEAYTYRSYGTQQTPVNTVTFFNISNITLGDLIIDLPMTAWYNGDSFNTAADNWNIVATRVNNLITIKFTSMVGDSENNQHNNFCSNHGLASAPIIKAGPYVVNVESGWYALTSAIPRCRDNGMDAWCAAFLKRGYLSPVRWFGDWGLKENTDVVADTFGSDDCTAILTEYEIVFTISKA